MYKLPEKSKKRITKMKKRDKDIWSSQKLKKSDAKFTKQAKVIRNVLMKSRLEKRSTEALRKKWNKITRKELKEYKKKSK